MSGSKTIEIQGQYESRFEPVAKLLAKQIKAYGGGAAACVYLEGRCVVDIWAGKARKDGTPWQEDTMAICYSGTKGVTATAIHMLASEGLIDYDAAIADYWLEFAKNGKSAITVRHVLSHQAGLHKLAPLIDRLTDILDWDLIVSRLEETEPDFHPGTANGYHALTFGWLVGELIHRVSGLTVPEFIEQRIVRPLGLDGLYVGKADQQMSRMPDYVALPPLQRTNPKPLSTRYRVPFWIPPGILRDLARRGVSLPYMRELYSHPAFWKACIPAMNGVATARSLAKIYAALSLGGEIDGVRLVSNDVVRQSAEVQMKRPDKVVVYPLHWRLGYHRADAFVMDVPEAFGHFGLGGAGGWANPELKLSAALVHNGFPFSPIGQTRIVMMTAAIYESLGIYRGACHTLLRGPVVELF